VQRGVIHIIWNCTVSYSVQSISFIQFYRISYRNTTTLNFHNIKLEKYTQKSFLYKLIFAKKIAHRIELFTARNKIISHLYIFLGRVRMHRTVITILFITFSSFPLLVILHTYLHSLVVGLHLVNILTRLKDG
jgi:hypothetical protein